MRGRKTWNGGLGSRAPWRRGHARLRASHQCLIYQPAAWRALCAVGEDPNPPFRGNACIAHALTVGKRQRASYSAPVVTFARAYRVLVPLACAVFCWWFAPTYVWASLSHRTPLSFPDRAEHAVQQDISARLSDPNLTSNLNPTRRVGARDEGKAAAERRWVGASPDRWGHSMYFYDPAGRLLESRQFRLMETFLHDPASSIIEYATQTHDGDVAAISVFTRPSQRMKAEYGKGGRLLKKRE